MLREQLNGDGPEKYLTTHHQRDTETGLDYRGARYYDSEVARFLSLDPLAADYASWSPYNYVAGNPISLVDPDGRSWWDVIVGGTMAVANNFGASGVPAILVQVAAGQTISNRADYDKGAMYGHVASLTAGQLMEVDGARRAAAGLTVAGGAGASMLVTAGADSPIAAPIAVAGLQQAGIGAVEGIYGGYIANNARQHLMARREGDFTPKQKTEAKTENAARNGGEMKCEGCGRGLENVKNEKGVPTPKNQAQVHHDPPIVDGGGRGSERKVVCPDCHKNLHR